MIPHGVDIYLGVESIDLRWGFDRLCGVVEERIGRRARSGAVFAFFGRRRTAMKVFYFDGTGLCVFYKRLDAGTSIRADCPSSCLCPATASRAPSF